MPVNFPGMVRRIKSIRFTLLGGDITDIVSFRAACQDGIRNPLHQQVRQQTGIQAARTDQDQIRVQDGWGGRGKCRRFCRIKPDLQDFARILCQLRLAPHLHDLLSCLILHFPYQLYIAQSRRQHLTIDRQNPAGFGYRFFKTAGDFTESCDEEVSHGMPFETSTRSKTVLKNLWKQRFVAAKSWKAVADVSGRQYPQVASQFPRWSTVIRDSNNSRDVVGVFLQASQECRQSMPTANDHNLDTLFALTIILERIPYRFAIFLEWSQ